MEVFVFVVFCLAYVLPAIIASSKAHPNSGAIWLFTLFLGLDGGCVDYSFDMGFEL